MFDCYLLEYNYVTNYRTILELQQIIRRKKEQDYEFPEFLMVLQHDHVFTLGKKANMENILISPEEAKNMGVEIIKIQRGGDVTYHGPGQLVGYFLLNLNKIGLSIKNFVWKMEETIIQTLEHFNIKGFRKEEYPGVWVKYHDIPAKIAAIGARASRMITSHGIALNVNTDLNYFKMIIPCGIKEFETTSIKEILGRTVEIKYVYEIFEKAFEEVFHAKLHKINQHKLLKLLNGDV